MTKLAYPKDPTSILSTTLFEPMKITLDGEPCIAIRLVSDILLFKKDGAVVGYNHTTLTGRVRFVDYLTEDESITVFGSSTGRPEDDPREQEVDENVLVQFTTRIGEANYLGQPLYLPFYVRRKGSSEQRVAILARYQPRGAGAPRDDITIIIDRTGFDFADPSKASRDSYLKDNYAFCGMAPIEKRAWFRSRGKNYDTASPADYEYWPE